jgi:hypothetical protein
MPMPEWNLEQVWRLAPDAGSASAARGLAAAGKWQLLGRAGAAIWGLCQGSGKDPYRACFDRDAAAFKCSCPSRKQPCKHALALLAVYVQAAAAFAEQPAPGWVAEWSEKRTERAARAQVPASAEKAPPNPEQAQKRADARRETMQEGLTELRLWLRDLARQGFAARKAGLAKELQGRVKRLVDAQCPGAAGVLQEVAASLAGAGAEDRALAAFAELDLLAAAFERLDQLPDGLRNDVRTALGWAVPQEQALVQRGWSGDWQVLGVAEEGDADERLRSQRVWLREDASQRMALLLQYAFAQQPFARILPMSSRWKGELSPYPSAWPLRVAVKDLQPLPDRKEITLNAQPDWNAALAAAAEAFAANPFLVQVPLMIRGCLWQDESGWSLTDGNGQSLPVATNGALWGWLSLCGGKPANWFGEWDGRRFLALTMYGAVQKLAA